MQSTIASTLFCLCLAAVCVASLDGQTVGSPPATSSSSSPLWCRHTVLLYAQPADPLGFWTRQNLTWVVAYCDALGQPRDLMFDGFLILGFGCKSGRRLLPGAGRPANQSDWREALGRYLLAAQTLNDTCEDACTRLGRPEWKGKVILAVPYPDPRQRNFGVVAGSEMDFSREDHRVAAVRWYVDEALRCWNERAAEGSLQGVRLVGFYWANEAIGDSDVHVVKETSRHVHQKGFLMHWIPCLGGGRKDWKELGLDCVTQQINYQNPQSPGRPLSIFDIETRRVAVHGLHGVEMTPISREAPLNPRLFSWHQVFLANLDAALRLRWGDYAAITYYNGNEIPRIAANPNTHIFYQKLYRWLKGTLTEEDVRELSGVVLEILKSQGHIDDAVAQRISKAKTVLEQLQRMEEPKLALLEKQNTERLAPYIHSSANLLKNGSFEMGTDDWTLSRNVERVVGQVSRGKACLRLFVPDENGGGMVRAYARSVRVPVGPGQVVRLTAQVNLPEDLRMTSRGLIIGLSRFKDGKRIADWAECEVAQVSATHGWKRLTLHLWVDDKPCEEVEAIVGLCGGGVAFVDDVELFVLTK